MTSGTQKDRESVFARQRRLYRMIKDGRVSTEVIEELLPDGEAHLYERQLWDYKLELPPKHVSSTGNVPEHNSRIAEIVKDVVAFYNSYGGYLVVGVRDTPRELVGFDGDFDCDDLNRRIKAVTRHDVECHFARVECVTPGGTKRLALLLVPQRPDDREPAQFLRDAPASASGRKAYKARDIYFRQGDESKPAAAAEDFVFLCAQRRRQFAESAHVGFTSILDNNLGPRDPGLIKFIGREEYLQELWRWLCDRFSPGKLLAAHGGLGKTTIAREFAEDVIRSSPIGLERVVWLSAKQKSYSAILDKYLSVPRVDFSDLTSLLRTLLLELAWPEEMLDDQASTQELVAHVVESLKIIPSLIIVDDIDSLEPAQQQEVFHTMLQIAGQTVPTGVVASKVLFTSRLTLGAAPGQLLPVKGLEGEEFVEYVEMTAKAIGVPWAVRPDSRQMRRFQVVTDGSPTFAASILRLLLLGDLLHDALERWKGGEGEEVRRFAFDRELARLSESQVRTLYTLCMLGDTSTVELRLITESGEFLLRDDLGELRKYHLLALGAETPGGYRLGVPSGIRLMADLIRNRVRDPARIEKSCESARAGSAKLKVDVGRVVRRVVALWDDHKPREALEVAQAESKAHPTDADLRFFVGRAYLRLDPPDPRNADVAFRSAHDLQCQRPELIGLWVEAKKLREDWIGIIELTQLTTTGLPAADGVFFRCEAYKALAEGAYGSGRMDAAANYALKGATEADESFKRGHAAGRVHELNDMRRLLFEMHISVADRLMMSSDEHVQVWLAVARAFDGFVRRPAIIRLGIVRLGSWWGAVEERPNVEPRSGNLLRIQLEKIDRIAETLRRHEIPDVELIAFVVKWRQYLGERLEAYQA
jgi:hypothetical protein